LYDELEPEPRRDFNAHLLTCTVCRGEVAGLRAVRTSLARWEPPVLTSLQSAAPSGRTAWWHAVPACAQVAAALLFLGAPAGVANLDVRYDQNGLNITTGWMKPASPKVATGQTSEGGTKRVANPSNADLPWRADLAALEGQLRAELSASQAPAP